METWPTVLPDLCDETFSGAESSNTKRTEMDSGRIRQQQRFTRHDKTFNVLWKMTNAQYAIFQAWHEYKIGLGADYFYLDIPMADVDGTTGMVQCEVRFMNGQYAFDWQRGHWYITATLETENPPTLSEEELDDILNP